jgi:hypothetical protein
MDPERVKLHFTESGFLEYQGRRGFARVFVYKIIRPFLAQGKDEFWIAWDAAAGIFRVTSAYSHADLQ